MRLENRVVVVTGAAGTIGRAVCFLLAEHGGQPFRASRSYHIVDPGKSDVQHAFVEK